MAPLDRGQDEDRVDVQRRHHYSVSSAIIRREGNKYRDRGGGNNGGGRRGGSVSAKSNNSRDDEGDSSNRDSRNPGGNEGDGNRSSNSESGRREGRIEMESTMNVSSSADPSSSTTPLPSLETTVTSASTVTTAPATIQVTTNDASTSRLPSETSSVSSSEPSSTLLLTTASDSDTPSPTLISMSDSSGQSASTSNTYGSIMNTNSSSSLRERTTTTKLAPATNILPSVTNLALPAETKPSTGGGDSSMSPLTEQVLIAAGAIGAFIMIIAGLYFLIRMKKWNLFAVFHSREIRKSGQKREWHGWRRRNPSVTIETTVYDYGSDHKPIPSQEQVDTNFPSTKPKGHNSSVPSKADAWSEDLLKQGAASYQEVEPTSNMFSDLDPRYNNTFDTNATYYSRNTGNICDPRQTDVNHLSYLSSLSSGFGDAQIIIPEPDGSKQNAQGSRQSVLASRNFSWVSSVPGSRRHSDKESFHTRSSVESRPRYRTINSWIVQQSGQIERTREKQKKAPNILDLTQTGVDYQRKVSEDPAFQHHPGEEVAIRRGLRVPSAILDRKIALN